MLSMGIKRVCMFCSTKFYDFGKTPIVCPKCGAPFDQNMMFKKKGRVKDLGRDLMGDNFEIEDDIGVSGDDDMTLDMVDDSDEDVDISSDKVSSEEE